MIRANLLLDDGKDPRDVGGTLGLITGVFVVIVCMIFVVIADSQIRRDSEAIESSNTELRGQISELSTNAEQLREMNTKIESIESFIETLDLEAQTDTEVKNALSAFNAVFAERPRRTSERRALEDKGWDVRWTIVSIDRWSLQLVDKGWTFTGTGASAEDVHELALRLDDLEGITDHGFESLTVTAEDPLTYAFEWAGSLAADDEEGEQ